MSILVVGFFGEGNLGDEAILEGLAASLPAGCPLAVTAGSQPLGAPAARLPRRGMSAWPAFLRAVREARHVVLTGGILQDWSFDGVVFYALRMLAASLAGRPPGLWGTGLGPLRHHAARAIAARVLRRAGPVWVRSRGAARLFHELTGREAHLGCDWSWAIPDPVPETAGLTSGAAGGPSLVPLPGDGTGLAGPAASVGAAARRASGPEGPLPHPPPSEATGFRLPAAPTACPALADWNGRRIGLNLRPWADRRFLDRARRGLAGLPSGALLGVAARSEDARLLRASFPGLEVGEPASFTDLMRLGRRLSEGWAMRFHVVLAWLRAGLPVVPLAYDNKVDGLCREVQAPDSGRPPSQASSPLEPTTAGAVLADAVWAMENRRRFLAMQTALREALQTG